MTAQEFFDKCKELTKCVPDQVTVWTSHSMYLGEATFSIKVKVDKEQTAPCKVCAGKGIIETLDNGFVKSMTWKCNNCHGTGKVKEA